VYNDFVNANGTEITQDLKLRIVPFTATVRFLPMGHHNGIQPYIGAGVGVFNYRYTETGQFLASDNSIFSGNFVGSGTERGPVILGGVRVPAGSWAVGGEIRYQSAAATLPSDQGFSGTKIDLGGINYLLTINFRF
jgi:outer membrane protein W